MKKILTLLMAVIVSTSLFAQGRPGDDRPSMYGFSKVTHRISSEELAEEYYSRFLGFDRCFVYESIYGTAYVYKVNDRQFLEFIVYEGDVAEAGNFISATIQTPDVEGMHKYIASKGYEVSDIIIDGANNKLFTTKDDRGTLIEFADMNSESKYALCEGNYLSPRRISDHIVHVGLHSGQVVEQPKFWCDVLGFKEHIRAPENRDEPMTLIYHSMPGSTECIEGLNRSVDSPIVRNFEHPCFGVANMQFTLDELRKRDPSFDRSPSVGRTKRRLLGHANSDGTKIEFTEQHSVH